MSEHFTLVVVFLQGPMGPRGESGLQGRRGKTGRAGLDGERGASGMPGPKVNRPSNSYSFLNFAQSTSIFF